ncbi:unnamed protein product [Arabis nemorensis]|uniref:Uncharacterized protein n=1 Tax=Arabis nemorensis TaxID=586526 RepID=A0A565BHY8_9BRAS|nr:unnamed protein product [Arabis nemorensis]
MLVSCLGDKEGNAKGKGFLLLDSDFNVKSRWDKPGHSPLFGYDFWYQPRHKTLISTSWGAPKAFLKDFNLQHVADGLYGSHLHVYKWPEDGMKQITDLGDTGLLPLEVTLHNRTIRIEKNLNQTLSLDGKQLYATNSLFSAWDRQFYPELIDKGSHIIQIDVHTNKGWIFLAHEMRYPGGEWILWLDSSVLIQSGLLRLF